MVRQWGLTICRGVLEVIREGDGGELCDCQGGKQDKADIEQ